VSWAGVRGDGSTPDDRQSLHWRRRQWRDGIFRRSRAASSPSVYFRGTDHMKNVTRRTVRVLNVSGLSFLAHEKTGEVLVGIGLHETGEVHA